MRPISCFGSSGRGLRQCYSLGVSLPPLQPSDFLEAFPSSRKVYVEEHGVRVPMREIVLTAGETLRVYDTSGPQGHDVRKGLPKLREPWTVSRRNAPVVTQLHYARTGLVTPEMAFVAAREGFEIGRASCRERV